MHRYSRGNGKLVDARNALIGIDEQPFPIERDDLHFGRFVWRADRLERIGRCNPRRQVGKERTEFVWEETLTFPLWMGGAAGARIGGPVMARLWRRNLSRLKHHVELDDQPVGRLANA